MKAMKIPGRRPLLATAAVVALATAAWLGARLDAIAQAQRGRQRQRDLEEVLALARSELIDRHVTVSTRLTPHLPGVLGDRVQLQQVMLNLLSNACDALKGVNPRDRRITIGVGMRGPGRVRISVNDNGCGFADGNPEHLFKPFVTTKRSGLGLGLSISRSIIDAHGGTIWAENNLDAGATFHVELAVAAQSAERVVA